MSEFTVAFGGTEILVSRSGSEGKEEAAWKAWEAFGDCPINEADEIDEDFLGYPAGTDRFDIWHDIEDDLGVSIYKLMTEEPPSDLTSGESLDEMYAAKSEEAELGNSGYEGVRDEMERE